MVAVMKSHLRRILENEFTRKEELNQMDVKEFWKMFEKMRGWICELRTNVSMKKAKEIENARCLGALMQLVESDFGQCFHHPLDRSCYSRDTEMDYLVLILILILSTSPDGFYRRDTVALTSTTSTNQMTISKPSNTSAGVQDALLKYQKQYQATHPEFACLWRDADVSKNLIGDQVDHMDVESDTTPGGVQGLLAELGCEVSVTIRVFVLHTFDIMISSLMTLCYRSLMSQFHEQETRMAEMLLYRILGALSMWNSRLDQGIVTEISRVIDSLGKSLPETLRLVFFQDASTVMNDATLQKSLSRWAQTQQKSPEGPLSEAPEFIRVGFVLRLVSETIEGKESKSAALLESAVVLRARKTISDSIFSTYREAFGFWCVSELGSEEAALNWELLSFLALRFAGIQLNSLYRLRFEVRGLLLEVASLACFQLQEVSPEESRETSMDPATSRKLTDQMAEFILQNYLSEPFLKESRTRLLSALSDIATVTSVKATAPRRVSTGLSFGSTKEQKLEDVDHYSMLRFKDKRMKEVLTMLRSDKPVDLALTKAPEISDLAFFGLQQEKLLHLCIRTLSLGVGRAMATYQTKESYYLYPTRVPQLNLHGKNLENDAVLKLDLEKPDLQLSQHLRKNLTGWPCFHNGVAVGLRFKVPGNSSERSGTAQSSTGLMRSWLLHARPKVSSYDHAGVMLGVGLLGRLNCSTMTDVYRYLKKAHQPTTIALLLGLTVSSLQARLSIAKRSSSNTAQIDEDVSKLVCVHIPAAYPPQIREIKVITGATQSVALICLGLLYTGTKHSIMVEFLLAQMLNYPRGEETNYECYCLFAGVGVGLILLDLTDSVKRSKESQSLRRSVLVKLNHMINGGVSGCFTSHGTSRVTNHRSHSKSSSGLGSTRGRSHSFAKAINYASARVKPGKGWNTSATAPGALLAVCFAYMKTHSEEAVAVVDLPSNAYELKRIRPDFLLLRVLCKCLIMWEDIAPTEAFILSNIPEAASRKKLGLDLKLNILAGSCFALGLKFAGTQNPQARQVLLYYLRCCYDLFQLSKVFVKKGREPFTYKPLPNNCLYESIQDLVFHFPSTQILNTCLVTLAASLSIVQAGACDLESLRLLRQLRYNLHTLSYGHHMGLNMAIGMLSLSGGRCTVKHDPLSLASLIISFYPVWPVDSCDNQYHHQSLRHLYVLAVENCVDKTVVLNEWRQMRVAHHGFEEPLQPSKTVDSRHWVIQQSGEHTSAIKINKLSNWFLNLNPLLSYLTEDGEVDESIDNEAALEDSQSRLRTGLVRGMNKKLTDQYLRAIGLPHLAQALDTDRRLVQYPLEFFTGIPLI